MSNIKSRKKYRPLCPSARCDNYITHEILFNTDYGNSRWISCQDCLKYWLDELGYDGNKLLTHRPLEL